MPSYELDKLVMLLSADWFLPYWHLIGIFIEDKKRSLLLEGFRKIVLQIMSSRVQYWDTDFSVSRVKESGDMLEALLKRCEVEAVTMNRIASLVSRQESPIDEGTKWLVISMTEQLIDSSITLLDTTIIEALRREWNRWQNLNSIDFKTSCLSSTSTWDQYLRNTTPDLPTMLADYVSVIASNSKFDVLWGFINLRLTAKQRHELLSWYRATGKSLTGELLRLTGES